MDWHDLAWFDSTGVDDFYAKIFLLIVKRDDTKLLGDFDFQQDGAPSHKSKKTIQNLEYGIKYIKPNNL